MTRTYLVVFEKGSECRGAFAPDVPGTAGMGDDVDAARQSLRDGLELILEDIASCGDDLPEAKTHSVDFSEFEPDLSSSRYEIEWMTVALPAPVADKTPVARAA